MVIELIESRSSPTGAGKAAFTAAAAAIVDTIARSSGVRHRQLSVVLNA